jgi:uncharacterized protein (TIGR03437 family)
VATTLAGTQVMFDGVAAPILFTQNGQVNASAPVELQGKTSTKLTVIFNGTASAAVTLPVVPASPGLFTADSSGKGQGAILNQDFSVNSATNPAAVGSVIQLFGTGGGQTNPASTDGELNPLTASIGLATQPVLVTIGGQAATVEYAGPAPSLVEGIMQINAVIPAGVVPGPATVTVTIGSVVSQTVTVAVN